MNWRTLHDENVENKNAGNGGDLVKHTVYLTTLDYLLGHAPWKDRLRVRECHAGRGMYRIPGRSPRRTMLENLYDPINADNGVILHDVQRAAQTALGVWPVRLTNLEWYCGSAVVNSWMLGNATQGSHRLELYERQPETRSILRSALGDPGLQLPRVGARVLPEPETHLPFDGEGHIQRRIRQWDEQDLVLLDPFAMWRQCKDQRKRDAYREIIDGLVARGQKSPLLILFWTWGQAFPTAEGDLNGTRSRAKNGYQDLRDVLHRSGRRFIRVVWCWGIWFAMWVVVPESHVEPLCAELRWRCDELRDHLRRGGTRQAHPDVEVTID